MKHYFLYLSFGLLSLLSCTDGYDKVENTDIKFTTQSAVSNAMAHIQRCSKDIGYLVQRRYSALDAKSKFAQYHVSSDILWIYIPLVRYLCDSVSTVRGRWRY